MGNVLQTCFDDSTFSLGQSKICFKIVLYVELSTKMTASLKRIRYRALLQEKLRNRFKKVKHPLIFWRIGGDKKSFSDYNISHVFRETQNCVAHIMSKKQCHHTGRVYFGAFTFFCPKGHCSLFLWLCPLLQKIGHFSSIMPPWRHFLLHKMKSANRIQNGMEYFGAICGQPFLKIDLGGLYMAYDSLQDSGIGPASIVWRSWDLKGLSASL